MDNRLDNRRGQVITKRLWDSSSRTQNQRQEESFRKQTKDRVPKVQNQRNGTCKPIWINSM